jgi:tetratricopeptide (TPR) repeat protein
MADTRARGCRTQSATLWLVRRSPPAALLRGPGCLDPLLSGDLLEWGWLENRPFLRCLCSLGLRYEWEGRLEEALAIYQELLSFNPNDNQGVRALAVTVLFALKRPEEGIKVCMAYPDDGTSEIAYGRALALFQVGRDHEATTALKMRYAGGRGSPPNY